MRLLTPVRFSVLLAAGVLFSGCYTVEFHETSHPVSLKHLRTGPGGAEGELFDCIGLEQKSYSGRKMAIGLFPGQPFVLEEVGTGPVWGTIIYAFWVPIGNVFFALPTICTVCVEPFVQTSPRRKVKDGDLLAFGLLGAFRWKSAPHVEDEEEYRECAVLDGGYQVDFTRIPRGKSADGTVLWFEYPGYRALKTEVDAAGAVDVLFADGSRIRRFVVSENNENHLAYEDRDSATEPAVSAQFVRYCEWKSLLLQTKRLRYMKGYATADAELKRDVAALELDIHDILSRLEDLMRIDLSRDRAQLDALRQKLEALEKD